MDIQIKQNPAYSGYGITPARKTKPGFSGREIADLILAWAILSLAFSILYSEKDADAIKIVFPICLATVGLGFMLHELGHKILAQHYGLEAVFKANYPGLIGAVLLSFAGFVLVTPGAVMIRGATLTKQQEGKISLTGPLMNLLLAASFLALYLNPLLDIWILKPAFWMGYQINAWIGLFNLIPSPPFDGHKIKEWNMPVYLLMAVLTGGVYLMSYTL